MNNHENLSTFDTLAEPLKTGLNSLNITTPTAIQAKTYHPATAGADILAQSRTGSGKTLAFLLPTCANLLNAEKTSTKGVKAVIMTPTRELAQQIERVGIKLLKTTNLKMLTVIGGDSYVRQQQGLARGAEIVVGTPGRIADLLRKGMLDLSQLKHFILDEVDEMLTIGFLKELEEIRQALPDAAQVLFFSATLNPMAMKVSRKYLKNPQRITNVETSTQKSQIEHASILVKRERDKIKALTSLLLFHQPESALIFCETKADCAELTESLCKNGFSAKFLNSDLNQSQRTHVMSAFKTKKVKYLVATNIAARGIDVDGLPLVVNVEPPQDSDSYTHRTGRTGRAGKSGKAWTLVTPEQYKHFMFLVKRLQIDLIQQPLPAELEFVKQRIDSEIAHIDAFSAHSTTTEGYVEQSLANLDQQQIRDLFKKVLLQSIGANTVVNPAHLQWDPATFRFNQSSSRPSRRFSRHQSFDRSRRGEGGGAPRYGNRDNRDSRGPRSGGGNRFNSSRRSKA